MSTHEAMKQLSCSFGDKEFTIQIGIAFQYDVSGDHETGARGPVLDDWDVDPPEEWCVLDGPGGNDSAEIFLCKALAILFPISNDMVLAWWQDISQELS